MCSPLLDHPSRLARSARAAGARPEGTRSRRRTGEQSSGQRAIHRGRGKTNAEGVAGNGSWGAWGEMISRQNLGRERAARHFPAALAGLLLARMRNRSIWGDSVSLRFRKASASLAPIGPGSNTLLRWSSPLCPFRRCRPEAVRFISHPGGAAPHRSRLGHGGLRLPAAGVRRLLLEDRSSLPL
jgi:hypothetical protein